MNPNLILITEEINFGQLQRGEVTPVEVYKQQMNKWLFVPIKHLANLHEYDKDIRFSHGYAVFALQLMFFEPHGKYLKGTAEGTASSNFKEGFNRFQEFLLEKEYINNTTNTRLASLDFYRATRCGIYHSFTMDSKILIDSRKDVSKNVFELTSEEKVLVYPWNFTNALEEYFDHYLNLLKNSNNAELKQNFQKTFTKLFTLKH